MGRGYDDGWVSKNFREAEFACPCCGKYTHNVRLIMSLEKLRRLCGHRPVRVNSGTRCAEWNKAVGGASGSKHLTGEAADVVVQGIVPEHVAFLCKEVVAFDHGGIGIYDTFTHLDCRHSGPARWNG